MQQHRQMLNVPVVRDINKYPLHMLGIHINISFYFFDSHTYDYYFLLTQFMSRMVLLGRYHFMT